MSRFEAGSAAQASDSGEDLFDKLDHLISRHQGRAVRQPADTPVPLLTEAVDTPSEPEIPVLDEVVHSPVQAEPAGPLPDRRRQLQVALYLRLRQHLDEALEAALPAGAGGEADESDRSAARLVQALRLALPGIVRESVEQVLGVEPRAEKD